MSCSIKDENGNLDPEAMKALVDVGGWLVEGGVRQYGDWARAMQAKVGDVFNNGDLRTIWMNVKADAAERTGFAQSMTEEDAFVQSLARRLGSIRRAADFANDLVDEHGNSTVMRKLVEGEPLTKAEGARVREAWANNVLKRPGPVKPTEGPMGAIQAALDEAKKKEPLRPNNGGPEPEKASPLSPLSSEQGRGAGEKPGTEPRTEPSPPAPSPVGTGEGSVKGAPAGSTPRGGKPSGKGQARGPAVPRPDEILSEDGSEMAYLEDPEDAPLPGEGLRELRSEQYEVQPEEAPEKAFERLHGGKGPAEPETDEKFDREMASRLGSRVAADGFREALGPDLYEKLVNEGPQALSARETTAVTRAFEDFDERAEQARRVAQTDRAAAMKSIAQEARASLAHHAEEARLQDFAKTRAWVKEQLAGHLSTKRMVKVGAELDKIQDGDTKALAAAFSRFMPRFFKTPRLYTQSAMLSNPNSLIGTALASHLMSAGVESTVATQIARGLSRGMHADIDPKLLAHAVVMSLTKGNEEAYGLGLHTVGKAIKNGDLGALKRDWNPDNILFHGENAATLAGKNSLHEPGAPLQQEITAGAGGKAGNVASTVLRGPGRMHGAVWHAVGVGLDEIARQNAAHYAAIDEMTSRGIDWRAKENRAELRARTRELRDAPTQKVLDTATTLRQEQMFQNPNLAASGLEKIGLAGTPVAPFVKVGGNITGRAIEHTPVGAAASIGWHVAKILRENKLNPMDYVDDFAGFKEAWNKLPSADKAHLAKIAARGLIGTGVGVAGYAGYKKKIVNAPSPGRGEYGSVNIGGRTVDAGRVLGPYSMPLFLGAEAARAAEQKRTYNPAGITETMKDLVDAGADNPWSNVGEVTNSLTEPPSGKGHKQVSKAAKVAGSVLRGEIPSIVGAAAALTDRPGKGPWAHRQPMMRDANTDQFLKYLWNVMKAATPGARESLPLKRIKGRTIPDATPAGPWPRSVPAPLPEELASERREDARFAKSGR